MWRSCAAPLIVPAFTNRIDLEAEADKYIDAELSPNDFKELIGKKPYNIEVKHYLKSLNSLPKRAKKEYEIEKDVFFKSLVKV